MNILLIALLLLSPVAGAVTYETDPALEREAFLTAEPGSTIADAKDDLTVFHSGGLQTLPSLLADLTSFSMTPSQDGWQVSFSIKEALPDDPGMPVNFNLYMDSDGVDENNAKDGVYRTGTDTMIMLLFGTRTKWHTELWEYDGTAWTNREADIPFTALGTEFGMLIPYDVLPPTVVPKVRAFSLTSDKGSTAVDVAPGTGLPDLLPAASGVQAENRSGVFVAVITAAVIAIVFGMILAAALRRK